MQCCVASPERHDDPGIGQTIANTEAVVGNDAGPKAR